VLFLADPWTRTTLTCQFHDNGDLGYARKGRYLNRFRCELNVYYNLHKFGVCDHGFVPAFYGYIDRVDPFVFHPPLKHLANDRFLPRAILLEYLPDAERLNGVNYFEDLFRSAVNGIQEIHSAFVVIFTQKICLLCLVTRLSGLTLMLRQLSAMWALVRRHTANMKPNMSRVSETFWFV
jgi:hypothetical protein